MHGQGNNIKKQQQETTFQRIERMHPHKMLLYLAIIGSSLIFVFMVIAYTLSTPQSGFLENFTMPKAFVCSTVLLLLSGFTSTKIIPAYKEDNPYKLKYTLALTLLLGLGFGASQYIGWLALQESGVYFAGKASGSFLYVLTGLHVAHLLGGLIFLNYLCVYMYWKAKDPVKWLITITNPYQKIKLQIFVIYWQFLDIVWVLLFFYFLFAF